MAQKRSRSREEIFADMHRELRAWNPKVPESPDRLDPILRILLQLYSHQLSQIDRRIDKVWDVAAGSLVKSLCPESKRWPVPAFTVMRAHPTDPVVEVDAHTKFFHKEEREGGQTFYFSPLRKERLLSAEVKHIYLKMDKSLIDLSPSQEESSSTHQRIQTMLPAGDKAKIFIAVDSENRASDFKDAALFLKGIPDALKQLRWAYWYPGNNAGGFHEDSGFCPGLTSNVEKLFLPGDTTMADWGGLRSSTDLFRPLEDNFVILPEVFAATWELGPAPAEVVGLASSSGISVPPGEEHYHWIRLDLPAGGDKSSIQSPFEVFFNCFVAVNKNELTIFKHTGGNRLVEIELPEDISSVLEITDVIDSNGRSYGMKHEILNDPSKKFYSLEDRNDKLVLWFDFTSGIELPPDSITLNYSVTSGVSANGIEAGKVNELYESHPGIVSVENIIPVSGAIPAKTEEQILTEVSARLRNRDRVLSFTEIANWARTFDPRIRKVTCRNGVERAERGVRRCIITAVTLKATDFYSDDEIALLKARLNSFLKSRSPVNSRYQIEIEKT
jgi:hypothetical protein